MGIDYLRVVLSDSGMERKVYEAFRQHKGAIPLDEVEKVFEETLGFRPGSQQVPPEALNEFEYEPRGTQYFFRIENEQVHMYGNKRRGTRRVQNTD